MRPSNALILPYNCLIKLHKCAILHNIIMMWQNKNKKTSQIMRWSGGILVSLVLANVFVMPLPIRADDVNTLNKKIESKRNEVDTLQKEIDAYQEQITAKQKEARSLQNQIAILQNQIAKLNLDIEASEKNIEQTNLEIQRLNIEIKNTEGGIDDK